MKQGRLALLAATALALGVVRWQFPPRPDAASAVVLVAERASSQLPAAQIADALVSFASPTAAVSNATEAVGNAFSVRVAEVPAPVTLAPAPMVRPRAKAPAPPPPPPPPPLVPPFQVVGTWDDDASPGVFVAGASDIVLVRQGSVVMSDYRVTAITREQLSLLHLPSNQTLQLNIPRSAPR